MTHREAIQTALAAWRAADRALADAIDGEAADLEREAEKQRDAYHRLSSDFMSERLDSLKDAEHRRSSATPSTPPFHQAARETQEIAADIWESGRQSDRDTPQR